MKNTILKPSLLIILALSTIPGISCRGNTPVPDALEYIFESGTEGYACYRIPAIVTTTDGIILAFAEARKNGCSDTGDIDLVMKRSRDQGKTWSRLQVIWDDEANVCGNPAPVVDQVTGAIHLLATWNLGKDHEREIIDEESRDTRRVFVMRSDDHGTTWTTAREITTSVKKENWTWYATGPCHGIQMRTGDFKGRLVVPCDHIEAGTKKYFSHTIHSDDHGQSWELGGISPQDQVNECTVAEITGGQLMLNMRNYDRKQKARKVAYSADGGESWSDIASDTALIEPICQASLLMLHDGKPCLLFLNPADENKRRKMTLKTSTDEGRTWTGALILHQGPSAYSDLTRLANGDIGTLFEAGTDSPYQGIAFKAIPRSLIYPGGLD